MRWFVWVLISASIAACAAPPSAVTINDTPVYLETVGADALEPVAAEPMDVVGSIAPAPTVSAASVAAPIVRPPPDYTPIAPTAQACCKVCSAGKACGDTCIARNKTCRTGRGCACDG